MNYSLQIESDLLITRQHQYHVNNYYNRLINKRIFNSVKPTPLLANEKQRNLRNTHKSLNPISRSKAPNTVPPNVTVKQLVAEIDKETENLKLEQDDSIFGVSGVQEDKSFVDHSKIRADTSRITDML